MFSFSLVADASRPIPRPGGLSRRRGTVIGSSSHGAVCQREVHGMVGWLVLRAPLAAAADTLRRCGSGRGNFIGQRRAVQF